MCEIKVKVKSPLPQFKSSKNGKKRTGQQNFKCKDCNRQFQYDYYYQGADPRVKIQIIRHLVNSSGIRDIRLSNFTSLFSECTQRQNAYELVLVQNFYQFYSLYN